MKFVLLETNFQVLRDSEEEVVVEVVEEEEEAEKKKKREASLKEVECFQRGE
jgi:hypothetical protein